MVFWGKKRFPGDISVEPSASEIFADMLDIRYQFNAHPFSECDGHPGGADPSWTYGFYLPYGLWAETFVLWR